MNYHKSKSLLIVALCFTGISILSIIGVISLAWGSYSNVAGFMAFMGPIYLAALILSVLSIKPKDTVPPPLYKASITTTIVNAFIIAIPVLFGVFVTFGILQP